MHSQTINILLSAFCALLLGVLVSYAGAVTGVFLIPAIVGSAVLAFGLMRHYHHSSDRFFSHLTVVSVFVTLFGVLGLLSDFL